MAVSAPDGSILIQTKLGTDEFQKGLKSLSRMADPTMQDLKKQIDTVASNTEKISKSTADAAKGFTDVDKSASQITLEKLVRDLDNTNAQIEVQERMLDDLRRQYERVKNTEGADSPKALKLEQKILKAEAALNKMTDASDKAASKIWELEDAQDSAAGTADKLERTSGDAAEAVDDLAKGVENAGEKLEDTGDTAEKSGEQLDKAKDKSKSFSAVLAGLVIKGIDLAIDAMRDLYDRAQELQTGMATLSTSAQLAGVGVEEVQEHLKELNRVSDETDSNVEALSNLMRAGFKGETLANVIQDLSGAVIAFPDTLKIESLADSLQEAIATGEVTGQFAEMLGRVGINVEDFSKRMEKAGGETARQQLVLSTLARTDLPALSRAYKQSNQDLIENRDAQFELDQAMLVIADQVMPIVTEALTGITNLLKDHADEITVIIGVIGRVAEVVLTIISILAKVPGPVWAVVGAVVAGITAFVQINKAVDSAKEMFGGMPKVISALDSPMTKTTIIILSIVAALTALAAIIAVVTGKSGELKSTLSSVSSSVGQISGSGGRKSGYAGGTRNAESGPHWVGENGPELLWFSGGEAIATAAQSRRIARNMQSGADKLRAAAIEVQEPRLSNSRAYSSPSTRSGNAVSSGGNTFYVTIDAKNVKEFNDVVRIAERRTQSYRQGYREE